MAEARHGVRALRGATAAGLICFFRGFVLFLQKCCACVFLQRATRKSFLSTSASLAPFKFSPARFCNLPQGDRRTAWKEKLQKLSERRKWRGFIFFFFFFPPFSDNFSAVSLPDPACSFCSWGSISSCLLMVFFLLYFSCRSAAGPGWRRDQDPACGDGGLRVPPTSLQLSSKLSAEHFSFHTPLFLTSPT